MEPIYCFAICSSNPSLFTNQSHLSKHTICFPASSLRKFVALQNVSSHTTLFPLLFKRRYHSNNLKISTPSSTASQVVFCTGGELNPCLPFQTLKTFPREELLGKVVMVRFDSKLCPMDNQFNFEYPNDNAIKTLKYLSDVGAKVVIVTHWIMSKISGEVSPAQTLTDYLSISLGKNITAIEEVIGDNVENSIDKLQIGDILLLGNLSLYKEEVANCRHFARNLSAKIDILVNDTFCDTHRVLASTVGVARFTYASVAGFHLADIMSLLTKAIEKPEHPFIAIVGGAKIVEKASIIRSLLCKCDTIAFIGTMSFTFLSALGFSIFPSLLEKHARQQAIELLDIAKKKNVRVLLPRDFWCINAAHSYEHIRVFEVECIPQDSPLDWSCYSLAFTESVPQVTTFYEIFGST